MPLVQRDATRATSRATMNPLCSVVSMALLVGTFGLFAWNILRQRWDLLSWRNVFLLGMAHFYYLGGFFSAENIVVMTDFHIGSPQAFDLLAWLMLLFTGLYMASASWAMNRPGLTRVLPRVEIPRTTPGVVGTIGGLLLVALVAAIVPIPGFIGLIIAQIRGQLAAVAMGLATYFLLVRKFNPIAWAVFLSAFVIGLVAATVGTGSRRVALGVLLAIPWIWHYYSWRYRRPATNLLRVSAAAVIGALAVLFYSPMRAQDIGRMGTGATAELRLNQFIELMTNPKIEWELVNYLLYTDTVTNTLFILDSYPNQFAYMPMHGVKWFFANPIPRAIWPTKPEALGALLRDQMSVQANLGPGIIGHGWSEMHFVGVIYYAVFFGVLVGVFDRACRDRISNPFFVALIGGSMGNVMALPRGDTPLFMIQIMGGLVGAIAVLWAIRASFGPVMAAFPVILMPGSNDGPAHPHDDDDAPPDDDPDGPEGPDHNDDAPRERPPTLTGESVPPRQSHDSSSRERGAPAPPAPSSSVATAPAPAGSSTAIPTPGMTAVEPANAHGQTDAPAMPSAPAGGPAPARPDEAAHPRHDAA